MRGWRLLDDLGDDEEAVGAERGVGEGVFGWQAGVALVGAGDVDEGEGVGGRFDPGDIDGPELLHVAEDIPELASQALFFFRAQRDAGQVRDVMDVEVIGRHAGRVGREGTGSKAKVEARVSGRSGGLEPGAGSR